jgi:pre-mRNA-processing factor SLU7
LWSVFIWGYACCHSFVKNSFFTGEMGRQAIEAADSWDKQDGGDGGDGENGEAARDSS